MDTGCNVEELFCRYSDMVYRIAFSYGNNIQMAEDIVQEVFLRYLKKAPHFKSIEHEKAWFIRVTVNCCKSLLVSAWVKRVQPLEDTVQEQAALVFQDSRNSILYELVSGLPAKCHTVLYLYYYEEYQVKEIAKILHVTPDLVSARLHWAKKMIKNELLKERKGFKDETVII